MVEITFNVPADKIQRIVDAMKGNYPIPLNPDGSPMYSDNDWAKEAIKRRIILDVKRWEQRIAVDTARLGVMPDNDLVS